MWIDSSCFSSIILCYVTFKTVPSIFYQLYTINGNYTFPFVYCISTRETEDFYRRVLNQLIIHAAQLNLVLNPQNVLSDFEIAFMNAARDVFPDSSLKGCLFHLTQAIWKQTIMKGLKQQFKNC